MCNLTGNNLDNYVTGNAGANTIDDHNEADSNVHNGSKADLQRVARVF